MGRGLGEYMVRHGLKYAGLICHGEQNFFATKQRDGAAEQVLTEEYPEIRVCGKVNFLTEVDVYQKTLKLIGMYPEIQALYVSWDGPALEVIKALTELERDGLVYSQRTTGRFVTEDQAMIASAKRSLAERHIQAFLEAMTHLGYGREEILTLLRQEETKGGENNGSSGM